MWEGVRVVAVVAVVLAEEDVRGTRVKVVVVEEVYSCCGSGGGSINGIQEW